MSLLLLPEALAVALLAAAPGALNPNVTQGNIGSTVCVAGWTATVRPPSSYTTRLKIRQMSTLNLPGLPRRYEEDHLVPLALGGHPTSLDNLRPQRWVGRWGAHKKDRLESYLHKMVCKDKITLVEAQTAIRTDWVAAYKRYLP